MNIPYPVWVPQRRIYDSFLRAQEHNNTGESFIEMIARLMDPDNPTSLVGLGAQEIYSQYLNSHSGFKWCSPYVNRMFSVWGTDGDSDRLSYEGQLLVAQDLVMRFADIWEKRAAAYQLNYSILDSYDVQIDGTKSDDGTSELTHGHSISGTDATTHGHVISTENADQYGHTINGNSSSTNNQFGFNTTDDAPVPVASASGNDSMVHGGKDTSSATTTNSGVDSTTVTRNNTGKDTTTISNDNEYHETRKGRMGWHTPQDLIKKDLELWQMDLMSTILRDIDSILAIKVY